MNLVLAMMTGLVRALTPPALALSLVLMPFGEAACASPCGPGEPGGVHACALHAAGSDLPAPSDTTCCPAESTEGSQYLVRRQKPEERRNRLWNGSPVRVSPEEAALSRSVVRLRFSPSPFTLTPSDPLYVRHAAFLI